MMTLRFRKHLLSLFLLYAFTYTVAGGPTPVSKTVVVDQSGGADYTSIRGAIASVPSRNSRWIRIKINPGVYKEKINITADKPFILLEGSGADVTSIEWGDSTDDNYSKKMMDTAGTATFTSQASDMVFKGITFKNTFCGSTWPRRAVAALISGDRTSFYGCNFVGIQDTLCDLQGRHYFKDCRIEGYADFIWGYGRSQYENCNIVTVGNYPGGPGFVTAQGRISGSDESGFVFKQCSITGTAKVNLGRAWGPYSTVIFYQTTMSDVVVPQGWDSWGKPVTGITYAESGCSGPGAMTRGRVPWEKNLTPHDIRKYISISYIDGDGWLRQQP